MPGNDSNRNKSMEKEWKIGQGTEQWETRLQGVWGHVSKALNARLRRWDFILQGNRD